MAVLTPGEKEILDAIMEQNIRLNALEEWKAVCDRQAADITKYIESLTEESV